MKLNKVHQAVRERSGNTCDICHGTFFENMLCAHHLKTRGAHPELTHDSNNCLCVCQICHNKCHSGQITKAEQSDILKNNL